MSASTKWTVVSLLKLFHETATTLPDYTRPASNKQVILINIIINEILVDKKMRIPLLRRLFGYSEQYVSSSQTPMELASLFIDTAKHGSQYCYDTGCKFAERYIDPDFERVVRELEKIVSMDEAKKLPQQTSFV